VQQENKKISLPWLWPADGNHKACGAKTRIGLPCKNWPMKNGRRCKFHGGKSTGAITPEGKIKSGQANFKNGKFTVPKQKERTIHRFFKIFTVSDIDRNRIILKINAMSLLEFQEFRSRLQKHIINQKDERNLK